MEFEPISLKDSALEIPNIYANVHNASTGCKNSR